jgi:hypothetical protein
MKIMPKLIQCGENEDDSENDPTGKKQGGAFII